MTRGYNCRQDTFKNYFLENIPNKDRCEIRSDLDFSNEVDSFINKFYNFIASDIFSIFFGENAEFGIRTDNNFKLTINNIKIDLNYYKEEKNTNLRNIVKVSYDNYKAVRLTLEEFKLTKEINKTVFRA